jgi:hypothetical protein
MAKRLHFKNLRRALRWRKRHPHRRVTSVTVVSNAPIKPQPHHPLTLEQKIVAYCHQSLQYAGKMYYTETALRSQLFHRKPGEFSDAHADCSQFGSSILHWLGIVKAADTDWTGSMLKKYPVVTGKAPGRGVIWGPGTGDHFAILTEKTEDGSDWYVVGFGHQSAPDRSTLSGMSKYFHDLGKPGVRFLNLTG